MMKQIEIELANGADFGKQMRLEMRIERKCSAANPGQFSIQRETKRRTVSDSRASILGQRMNSERTKLSFQVAPEPAEIRTSRGRV